MSTTKSKKHIRRNLDGITRVNLPMKISSHTKAKLLAKGERVTPGYFMAKMLERALEEFEKIKLTPNINEQMN